MVVAEQIQQLIEPSIIALGYDVWGCVYIPQGRYSLLRIYIDNEQGITVDDCQKVSHQVSALLDVADPIKGEYHLEVSSPGMDRPLFKLEQYQRYIGSKLQLRLIAPLQNRRNFTGTLLAVTAEGIELELDNATQTLLYANIERANLVPEFNV